MKRLSVFLICFLVLVQIGCENTSLPRQLPPIEVYFSPKGGCTEAIVYEIDSAKASIFVQAYSFTSVPIAKAIANAHKRGVHIETILDKTKNTEKYSEDDYLIHAGVQVMLDGKHPIAHNKIIIIDGQVVITGSFNFTKQAENGNAENLLIIRDKAIADRYTANWNLHAAHSERYAGRKSATSNSNNDE
jgi:phosphatidylserine/phosphatidylglycerophosphate/cardiolipin synthase-like enzyme